MRGRRPGTLPVERKRPIAAAALRGYLAPVAAGVGKGMTEEAQEATQNAIDTITALASSR